MDGPSGAHARSNQEDSSASNQEVGVGIVFQPLDDGTLYVKRLKEGEPAARSGLIKVSTEIYIENPVIIFFIAHFFQVGDCLCEINGRDVFRKVTSGTCNEVSAIYPPRSSECDGAVGV